MKTTGVDRTAAARRARRLYADQRIAAELRDRGWTCFEPLTVVAAEKMTDVCGVHHMKIHAIDVAGDMPLPEIPADVNGGRSS